MDGTKVDFNEKNIEKFTIIKKFKNLFKFWIVKENIVGMIFLRHAFLCPFRPLGLNFLPHMSQLKIFMYVGHKTETRVETFFLNYKKAFITKIDK